MRKSFIVSVVLVASLVANLYLALQYVLLQRDTDSLRAISASQQMDKKALDFMSLFIKQVIRSDKEISFETRLKLENAVRDLKDDAILAEWQKFTNSKTEIEAQANVKELLGLLVDRVKK